VCVCVCVCVCVEQRQGECANTEAHPKTAAQARSDNTAAPSTNGGQGGCAESDVFRVECGDRDRIVDGGAGVKERYPSGWWAGKKLPTARQVILSLPPSRLPSLA
jgi:hypothetical protein